MWSVLRNVITKNPGLRIEQIGKALGTATKELVLPVKKLIAAKLVSARGQRRATKYYAGKGGRGAAKPAAGKRRAKKVRVKRAKKQARAKTQRRASKRRAANVPPAKAAAPVADASTAAS